jgi:hypothetical protein
MLCQRHANDNDSLIQGKWIKNGYSQPGGRLGGWKRET